jgi:cytoskeletal protein RodZ
MEGLGKKLQDARIARNLTLDEAARMTKIRPSHLAELEAEDFSHFASLAYAKGFLQIYGKFLNVDVSSYLEMFETSEQMTVDGYSYLQDHPAPKPRRTIVERRPRAHASFDSGGRARVWPIVLGFIAVLVGFFVMKLILDIHRLAPQSQSIRPETIPTPGNIVAPRAVPIEGAPSVTVKTAPSVAPTNPPAVAVAPPKPSVAASQPEVRRAEPVHPEDLVQAGAAPSPAADGTNRVEIRPLKKTYIKVVVNNDDQNPALEQWISPSEGALHFEGQRIAIRLLDREAVQIRKNGKPVSNGDADLKIE